MGHGGLGRVAEISEYDLNLLPRLGFDAGQVVLHAVVGGNFESGDGRGGRAGGSRSSRGGRFFLATTGNEE
ncbi:hypothetical protein D3C83_213180 [compost metagenome]